MIALLSQQIRRKKPIKSHFSRFPALRTGYTCLLKVSTGSLVFLHLLWLARVNTLILTSRNLAKNCSRARISETQQSLLNKSSLGTLWAINSSYIYVPVDNIYLPFSICEINVRLLCCPAFEFDAGFVFPFSYCLVYQKNESINARCS